MKKVIVLLLVMILNSVTLYAGEAGKDEKTSSFWDAIRKKIELLVPKKKLVATTATGGVRGAQTSTDDVYWKGDTASNVVDGDELDAFKKAVDLVGSGDKKQARDAFEEFVKTYPESSLRKDADEALAQLQLEE